MFVHRSLSFIDKSSEVTEVESSQRRDGSHRFCHDCGTMKAWPLLFVALLAASIGHASAHQLWHQSPAAFQFAASPLLRSDYSRSTSALASKQGIFQHAYLGASLQPAASSRARVLDMPAVGSKRFACLASLPFRSLAAPSEDALITVAGACGPPISGSRDPRGGRGARGRGEAKAHGACCTKMPRHDFIASLYATLRVAPA